MFFKKYIKQILISLSFFTVFSGIYVVKYHLPTLVEGILRVAVGPKFTIHEIKFPQFGEIEVLGVTLSKDKKTILETEEIKIKYSEDSLKKFRLENMYIKNPWIHIVRDGSSINIIDAFSSGESETEENIENYKNSVKAGSAVPIDRIDVENAKLLFTDKTYTREIEKKLTDVNGYLEFSKTNGINLDFKGFDKKEIYEFRFNNLNEPLEMNIVLKDIEITPELIQYGFDDEHITKASGNYNMDLTIATSGLYGKGELKDASVFYDDLAEEIVNINGDIDFKKDDIDIKFDFLLDKNPGIFKVFYSDETGVRVDFKFKDISYKTVSQYKLLGEMNLPLEKLMFSNVDVAMFYKEETGFKVEVDYKAKENKDFGIDINNINGKVIFKDDRLSLSADEILFTLPSLEYIKPLSYDIILDLSSENLKFDINSTYIDVNGEYNKEKEILKLYQDSKLSLIYDLKTKDFGIMNLKTKNILGDYETLIKIEDVDENILYGDISIMDADRKKVLDINGYLEKDNLKYLFKININDLKEKNILKKYDSEIDLSFIGEIAGEKDIFILRGVIQNLSIKSEDILLNSYADISVVKNTKLQAELNGEIKEIKYKENELEGIKLVLDLDDNILKIKDFGNRIFNISGDYNLSKDEIFLKYKITGLETKQFIKLDTNVIFEDVVGNIKGKTENLFGSTNIKKAIIETPGNEKVFLTGDIKFQNNKISSKNLKINQSVGQFNYDLDNKTGDFLINILEENLPKYYGYTDLKYRLLSRIAGKIKDKDIFIQSGFTFDKVFINGKRLPNLTGRVDYEKSSKVNKVNMKELNLLALNKEKIISGFGTVDLLENNIKFLIPKQKINLNKLEGIADIKDINGNIDIESEVKGKLEEINYYLNLYNGYYEIKGIKFEDISLSLKGDRDKIKLEELSIYYEKNKISGIGEYSIDSGKYNFDLYSKDVDLNFLNVLTQNQSIKDIEGTINFNIKLSSDINKNSGVINLRNISAKFPEALVELKKFNMSLEVDKDNLVVKKMDGLLNNGIINGSGYLKLPTIEEMEMDDEFYKQMKYSFNFNLKDFDYERKNYFKINSTTNLLYSNNKVSGSIVLNDGEINGIMQEDKGLIRFIISFLIDKTRTMIGESKKLGKEFEIQSVLEQTPEFDVLFAIKNPIKIDISDISTFVQDVEGELTGRFNMKGKNEKIAILGEMEIQKGKFVLGNNDFIMNSALLFTNKKNGYLNDFNPNISFNTSSITSNGNIEISLQGELNNLRLNIITNQGTESSALKNILNSNPNQNTEEKNIIVILFKTIIDSQITSTVFRPISRTVKDILHISKFRIVSDVFNQEILEENENSKLQDPSMFGFGAYLEAENPIYEDKYFWVFKMGIVDSAQFNNDSSTTGNIPENYSSTVSQYDFSIKRRYPSGLSYGIGVAKLNDTNMMEENKKGNLNYYIDFKYERKFFNIKDIFYK